MLFWNLPQKIRIEKPKPDLMHLFLSGVSRRFAVAMLSIFSPIYIYRTLSDFGLSYSTSLIGVMLYYFFVIFVKLLTLNFSEDLSRKIGFKATIRASSIPFFIFIILLIYASKYPMLFIAAAVLWGLHTGLFWWGYHGYFIKSGERGHFGESIGEVGFLETLAVIIAPLAGGIIATIAGFGSLFILAALFMLISLTLLGKDNDKRQKRDVSFLEVFEAIKKHKSVSLSYIGNGGESIIYLIIWPLFLYFTFGEVLTLGEIVTAASLLAALFSVGFGRWADKQGERKLVGIGTPLVFISWILRFLSRNILGFIVSDGLWNFGERMVALPLNALTYKKAFEGGSAKAILFRETTMIIGCFIALTLIIAWIFSGGSLTASFILAAVFGAFPVLAIVRKRI